MDRKRLRPAYTDEELAAVYGKQYDHTQWAEHRERVRMTVDLITMMCGQVDIRTVADLSCGDGAIINALPANLIKTTGSFTPGWDLHGKIEDTIKLLPTPVDLFICSETLEHIDDPDSLLREIKQHAWRLLLTTPLCDPALCDDSDNAEHYWQWNTAGVEQMLIAADFQYRRLDVWPLGHYTYQMWWCS